MKLTSNTIIFDTEWEMVQIKKHSHSQLWCFFAMINKNWYYGEGSTITEAIEAMELKFKKGKKNGKEKLDDIF